MRTLAGDLWESCLGQSIDALREPGIPIAVITNGSLLCADAWDGAAWDVVEVLLASGELRDEPFYLRPVHRATRA